MKTITLMTASSLFLGLAGLFALFAPEEFLKIMSLPQTSPLPLLIQLMGVLYLSFALEIGNGSDGAVQYIKEKYYGWNYDHPGS